MIDAELAAEKIWEKYSAVWATAFGSDNPVYEPNHIKKIIAKLITDNMTLDITWKDGKAEWGEFSLEIINTNEGWHWTLYSCGLPAKCGGSRCKLNSEEAAKACETALKKIICGIKE